METAIVVFCVVILCLVFIGIVSYACNLARRVRTLKKLGAFKKPKGAKKTNG